MATPNPNHFASGVSRLLPFGKRREQTSLSFFLFLLKKSTSIAWEGKMFLKLTQWSGGDRQVGNVPKKRTSQTASRQFIKQFFLNLEYTIKTILKNFPSLTQTKKTKNIIHHFFLLSCMRYVTSYDPSKYLCMNENIELKKRRKKKRRRKKRKRRLYSISSSGSLSV
jgi:hypothetical protein